MTFEYEKTEAPTSCTNKSGHKWKRYDDNDERREFCLHCGYRRSWFEDRPEMSKYIWSAPDPRIFRRLEEIKRERDEITAIIQAANNKDINYLLEITPSDHYEFLVWKITSETKGFKTGDLRNFPIMYVTTGDSASIDVGPLCYVKAGRNCKIKVHSFTSITAGNGSKIYCQEECIIRYGDTYIYIHTSDPSS